MYGNLTHGKSFLLETVKPGNYHQTSVPPSTDNIATVQLRGSW
jgi:hypothetical protein